MTCIAICKRKVQDLDLVPGSKKFCDFTLIHSILNEIPHVSLQARNEPLDGEIILLYLVKRSRKEEYDQMERENNKRFYQNMIQSNEQAISFNNQNINNLNSQISGSYSGYSCMYHTEKIGWINNKMLLQNQNSFYQQQNIKSRFEISKIDYEYEKNKYKFSLTHVIKNLDSLLKIILPQFECDYHLTDYINTDFDENFINKCKNIVKIFNEIGDLVSLPEVDQIRDKLF